MQAILHIIRKEFLQLKRDPRLLPIIFIAPVFQLLLLGYAANLDVKNIRMVICDLDKSVMSRELVSEFKQSGYFVPVSTISDPRKIDHYLDYGRASMALVIPENFAERIQAGKSSQLQIIVDGAEAAFASSSLQYASIIISRYSQSIVLQILEKTRGAGFSIPRVNPEIRLWYNPELKSRNFFIPGVLSLLLMVMTMLLTSLAIVKEKEMGTMEQLIVTPIKPYTLIIGKLAPFVIIAIIDTILVLVVAGFWFRVPVKGSILLLFGLTIIFLMTTLGLGLFISTVSKTQQQAMMTAMVFVMQPMIMLSGFVFPIENMPRAIQLLTYLLPLRYFIVIIRGIFLKGVGFYELWDQALVLLLFGIGILSLSVFRFRKKVL
jgi:ABC-2 type transport system permease protein